MNIIKYYAGYLVRYLRGTRAVAAMEYAIIVGVVVVGVGAAVVVFQGQITAFIEAAGTEITEAQTATFDPASKPFPFGLAGAKPGGCRPRCAGARVPSFV